MDSELTFAKKGALRLREHLLSNIRTFMALWRWRGPCQMTLISPLIASGDGETWFFSAIREGSKGGSRFCYHLAGVNMIEPGL